MHFLLKAITEFPSGLAYGMHVCIDAAAVVGAAFRHISKIMSYLSDDTAVIWHRRARFISRRFSIGLILCPLG